MKGFFWDRKQKYFYNITIKLSFFQPVIVTIKQLSYDKHSNTKHAKFEKGPKINQSIIQFHAKEVTG